MTESAIVLVSELLLPFDVSVNCVIILFDGIITKQPPHQKTRRNVVSYHAMRWLLMFSPSPRQQYFGLLVYGTGPIGRFLFSYSARLEISAETLECNDRKRAKKKKARQKKEKNQIKSFDQRHLHLKNTKSTTSPNPLSPSLSFSLSPLYGIHGGKKGMICITHTHARPQQRRKRRRHRGPQHSSQGN